MKADPFPDDALVRNAFLGGRVQLWQPVEGYRAGIDPVLLAARHRRSAVSGCGCRA